MEGIGVNGRIQDITLLALAEWMHGHLPELTTDLPGQLTNNRLNHYFVNGCFFTSDFDGELAFFVGDQRIYLKHHVERTIDAVEVDLAA